MTPFTDDGSVQTIGNLSIENGIERIVIHGDVEIARTSEGRIKLLALKETLEAILTTLDAEPLLDELVEPQPTQQIDNPLRRK